MSKYDSELHITAGALREAGAAISVSIPDHAYIPRIAMILEDIKCGPGQESYSISAKVTFDFMSRFITDEVLPMQSIDKGSVINIPVGDNHVSFPAVPRSDADRKE